MTPVAAVAAAVAIVAAAGMFRGLTGYGFSLIAALGLPYVLGVEHAVSVILLLEILTAAVMVDRDAIRQHVGAQTVALLGSGIAGSLVGAALSGVVGRELTLLVVNLSLVVASLAAFIRTRHRWLADTTVGVAVGFIVAVLLSGFAVGGPLLIAWLMAAQIEPDRARATMTVYFPATAISAVALRAVVGTLPMSAMMLAAALAPVAVGGVALGKPLQSRPKRRCDQQAPLSTQSARSGPSRSALKRTLIAAQRFGPFQTIVPFQRFQLSAWPGFSGS